MLLHCRGASNFAELRTVHGVLQPTYKEAAIALGILDEDHEVDRCLTEAFQISFPSNVRRMLAYLLAAGEVNDPEGILERHMEKLAEDYLREAIRVRFAFILY